MAHPNSWRRRLTRIIPDRLVVAHQFRRRLGRAPDLKDPQGFHEKICWLRLNRLTPLHSYCADKLTAAAYVASVIGPGYTVPRHLRCTDPERLSPETIPTRRCLIKTNHGSGGIHPIADTRTADWPKIRQDLRARLATNYHWQFREAQYRSIPPMVLVEDYLDQTGQEFGEVNFYCLNGVARFELCFRPGAILASQKGTLLDREGRRLAVTRQRFPTAQADVPVPPHFFEMRALAERLARPFPLVRVDFLLGAGRFFVSELTFTPLAGYEALVPESCELAMGALLDHRAEVPDWRPILAAARACEATTLPPLI